jgi:hypothetical protein
MYFVLLINESKRKTTKIEMTFLAFFITHKEVILDITSDKINLTEFEPYSVVFFCSYRPDIIIMDF